MNSPNDPFDAAPTSPPVSTDPPMVPSSTPSGPRRGRMAVGAVAVLGLLGAGVFGVSQLASADPSDPTRAVGAADDTADDSPDDTADDSSDDTADDSSDETEETTSDDTTDDGTGEEQPDDGDRPVLDGEIVIDLGDDPITIDLGALDEAALEEFRECAGLPDFGDLDAGPRADGDLDHMLDDVVGDLFGEDFEGSLDEWLQEIEGDLELPDLSGGELVFGPEGNQVTVLGPDGVTVVDLGDGDSSVTITQEDGELDISTDGDATVQDLPAIFDELEAGELELPPFEDLDELFSDELFSDDVFGQLPDLGELSFDLPDPDVIESCLAELG